MCVRKYQNFIIKKNKFLSCRDLCDFVINQSDTTVILKIN